MQSFMVIPPAAIFYNTQRVLILQEGWTSFLSANLFYGAVARLSINFCITKNIIPEKPARLISASGQAVCIAAHSLLAECNFDCTSLALSVFSSACGMGSQFVL